MNRYIVLIALAVSALASCGPEPERKYMDRAMEAFARQHGISDGDRDRLQRSLEACMRMKHEAWVAYARDLERAMDMFYEDVDRLSEDDERAWTGSSENLWGQPSPLNPFRMNQRRCEKHVHTH